MSDKLAQEFAEDYYDGDLSAIDPITILMIAGLLVNLIRLAYDCYKDRNKTVNILQKPSLLARMVLVRQIRKISKEYHSNINQKKLKEVILNRKISREELLSLLSEIEKND
jgi:hypothetical protein